MTNQNTFKILLVAEDQIERQNIVDQLNKFGYQIIDVVSNGKEAVDAINNLIQIDLIIMDLDINSEPNSIETINLIWEINSYPLLFFSNLSEKEIHQKLKSFPFASFINKPIKDNDLIIGINLAIKNYLNLKEKELDRTNLLKDQCGAVFKSIGQGIIVLNREHKIDYLNPLALGLTGWRLNKVRGVMIDEVFEIINKEDNTKVEFPHKTIKNGTAIELIDKFYLISQTKELIPIECYITPFKSKKGITGAIIVLIDVTEQVKLEEIRRTNEQLINNQIELKKLINNQKDIISQLKNHVVKIDSITPNEQEIEKMKQEYLEILNIYLNTDKVDDELLIFAKTLFDNGISTSVFLDMHMSVMEEIFYNNIERDEQELLFALRSVLTQIIYFIATLQCTKIESNSVSPQQNEEQFQSNIDEKDIQIIFDAEENELKVFKVDCEEQLQKMSNLLIDIEKISEKENSINELFRLAHTIKGNSAIIKHNRLVLLTHKIESVFDLIRSNKIIITPELISVLLNSIDVSFALLKELETKMQSGIGVSDILLNLDKYIIKIEKNNANIKNNNIKKVELNEIQIEKIKLFKMKGQITYNITVNISKEAAIPNVTILMLYENILKIGEILESNPKKNSLIKDEFDNNRCQIILISKEKADVIQEFILSLMDIESCRVELWKETSEDNNNQTQNQNNNQTSQFVKVNLKNIDDISLTIGDFVNINNKIFSNINSAQVKYPNEPIISNLSSFQRNISLLIEEMQQNIEKIRMVPIGELFNRFPRMVRSLADKLEKQINFKISGADFSVNKTILEGLHDPLTHLIRNSIDHGIEKPEIRKENKKDPIGNISLQAFFSGGNIVVEIQDDGKGLDKQRIVSKVITSKLYSKEEIEKMSDSSIYDIIFEPGFSTAENISDVSGRGVGMDIVKKKIQSLNGTISISTIYGQGTKISIFLPGNIIEGLTILISDDYYFMPLQYVRKLFKPLQEEIKTLANHERVVYFNNDYVPLVDLDHILKKSKVKIETPKSVMAIQSNDKTACLIIDNVIEKREFVIHDLAKNLEKIPGLLGTAIQGDGTIIKILDVPYIFQHLSTL